MIWTHIVNFLSPDALPVRISMLLVACAAGCGGAGTTESSAGSGGSAGVAGNAGAAGGTGASAGAAGQGTTFPPFNVLGPYVGVFGYEPSLSRLSAVKSTGCSIALTTASCVATVCSPGQQPERLTAGSLSATSDDFKTTQYPNGVIELPSDKATHLVPAMPRGASVRFTTSPASAPGFDVQVAFPGAPLMPLPSFTAPKTISKVAGADFSWPAGTQPGTDVALIVETGPRVVYCFAKAEAGVLHIPSEVTAELGPTTGILTFSRLAVLAVPGRDDNLQAVVTAPLYPAQSLNVSP